MERAKNIGIAIIAAAAVIAAFVLQYHAPVARAPEASDTGYPPIPHGAQTYGVGEAQGTLPAIRTVSVDAPDAAQGDTQTFSAVVSSDAPITSVVVTTKTDHGSTDTPLAAAGNASSSLYAGSWMMNDTHATSYLTTFTAKDAKGRTNAVTLTWRDPSVVDPATGVCGQEDGASFTLTATCVETGVDGINNANFTIATGGTLQLNNPAQFAWNKGFSIFISGTGKSLIAAGAAIKKGFVCFDGTSYFITPDSATCTADGGTLRNVNNLQCRTLPRPPDCL